MAFTLAKPSARSNSHRPSAGARPPADAVPELVRGVAMQHPGGEARGVALAFDAHPGHSDLREFAERGSVERRATGRVFFQAEDGIRDLTVTGVQTCALPI